MPMSMSSADWTRIQRLKQARGYAIAIAAKEDVLNVAIRGNPFNPETKISRVVGSSRTRRDASRWTDYLASQHQTYTLKSSSYQGTFIGTRNTLVSLNCNCGVITNGNTSVLDAKRAGCKCNIAQHLRI